MLLVALRRWLRLNRWLGASGSHICAPACALIMFACAEVALRGRRSVTARLTACPPSLWATGATRKPSHQKIEAVDGRRASQDSCKVHLDKVRAGISDSHPKSRILHQECHSLPPACDNSDLHCLCANKVLAIIAGENAQANPSPSPRGTSEASPTLRLGRA